MGRFTLVFLAATAFLLVSLSPVSADSDDLLEYIKSFEPLHIRKSPSGCPLIVIGQQCPEENVFWYFKCCGNIADQCCFRLQDWVTVLLMIFAVLTVLSIIVNCVRCMCCQ
ncbi:unnamed protein product [Caenorhabditis auriculariae]|uniref:Uncharacterized protein n=1 Tax=Caenorhabditis auriculariae TaxID=2777116 RepID=A0A8S1HTF6_9PELO|nr:unnamed protein product [Caenorhabditis auriculariae]